MAKLADAPVVYTCGEEPRIGSSPIAANYMGWITNGELGETANLSVLLTEYSGQNRIIPPCIRPAPIGSGVKAAPEISFCDRIGNSAYWLIN